MLSQLSVSRGEQMLPYPLHDGLKTNRAYRFGAGKWTPGRMHTTENGDFGVSLQVKEFHWVLFL
jgi:hypothetical protein